MIFFLFFNDRQNMFLRAWSTLRHRFSPYNLHIYSSKLWISSSLASCSVPSKAKGWKRWGFFSRTFQHVFLPFLRKLDIWSQPLKAWIPRRAFFCWPERMHSLRSMIRRCLSWPLSSITFPRSGRSLERRIIGMSISPELDLTTNDASSGFSSAYSQQRR